MLITKLKSMYLVLTNYMGLRRLIATNIKDSDPRENATWKNKLVTNLKDSDPRENATLKNKN